MKYLRVKDKSTQSNAGYKINKTNTGSARKRLRLNMYISITDEDDVLNYVQLDMNKVLPLV